MAYICECGNKDDFQEVFDVAVDIVDGTGKFVSTESRNVAYYVCQSCERKIGYTEFFPRAASTSPPPAS